MKWLKRKKTAPELPLEPPIWLGNKSNGEFFHQSTPMEQKIRPRCFGKRTRSQHPESRARGDPNAAQPPPFFSTRGAIHPELARQ